MDRALLSAQRAIATMAVAFLAISCDDSMMLGDQPLITASSREADCDQCEPSCGDGSCDVGEDCASSEADCGQYGPSCGDGSCDADEDCASCEADCGQCEPSCGDGSCDADEDCSSCDADCGTCPEDPPPGTIVNQYAGITTWCRVQTHNHVDRFDSVEQCVADYKDAGFDLIFYTSHDDDPQLDPIHDPDVVSVRGVEISDPQHGNALGISAAHAEASYGTIQEAIDAATAAGGIYQLNHPDRYDTQPSEVTPLEHLWGMEIGNRGTYSTTAEALWDSQISQGRPIWGTFTDDAHGSGVGKGWIDVGTASDCSQEAVLAAMREGAFVMSNGPTLTISVSGDTITAQSSGDTIAWYREDMTEIRTTAASSDTYTIAGDEVFVRVVVTDSSGDVVLSQPLFTR